MQYWKMIGYHEERRTCDQCGHDIKRCFTVESIYGNRMVVGSDCVVTLIDPVEAPKATLIDKRAIRAAGQWRKQMPKAKDGESRDQYIQRRVTEMGNAIKGYAGWIKALDENRYADLMKQRKSEVPKPTPEEWAKLSYPERDRIYYDKIIEVERQTQDEFFASIEQQYGANRYDFTNRTYHQIKKL